MKRIILVMVLFLIFAGMVSAAGNNITITCAADGPCTMAPNPNDPLFYETNMLPGDTVTKTLTVINQDETQACDLKVNAYNDRRDPTGTNFPSKLFSVITKDGSPFLSNTIQAIYTQQQIDLSTIPAGSNAVYDWTVTFDPNSDNYYQRNETIFDFDVIFSCGSEQVARLLLTKTNNRLGLDNSPGDEVRYTLEVTAVTDVRQVRVTDLPPQGFVYRPGSWTGVAGEPSYHSPGVWQLGDMAAGEVTTLTYLTDISNEQDPGVYPDLAWANGLDADNNEVYANVDSGFFVGTDVRVVKPITASATYSVNAGTVLGLTTELPATGASTGWVIFGVICVVIGIFGMRKKFFGILLVGLLMMVLSTPVMATDLSIRLSQPKTPTNQKNLDLSFVAMDLTNQPITVTCYGKKPSDGGFSQLGSSISLINGGTSARCPNTESLIQDNGTYQFKAVATNGIETVESLVISIEYKTDSAGTPINYSNEKTGSCEYRLRFKTADDSKTATVEIYRSDLDSFTADEGSRIATIDVGPNSDREYTDVIPDCGKTYYYALRAFTSSGNGSTLVGDIITTTTTDAAVGITRPVARTQLSQVSSVNPPPEAVGKVLGEQATPSATPVDDFVPDMAQSKNNKWWLILTGGALAGLILLMIRKRGK